MNKYKEEIINLIKNNYYENCISNNDLDDEKKCLMIKISKKLFEQAHFLLFVKQTSEQRIRSQIQLMKSAVFVVQVWVVADVHQTQIVNYVFIIQSMRIAK